MLTDRGVPTDEAEFYIEGLRRGGAVVAVDTDNAYVDRAVALMQRDAGLARGTRGLEGDEARGSRRGGDMETIERSVEIDVPVQTAYREWTHFEQFPRFMEGVESVEQIDDRRKLLEPVAEHGALTGGVLQEDQRPMGGPPGEEVAQGLRDQPQALLFGARRIGAGMHHQSHQSQCFRAIEFLGERRDRSHAHDRIVGGDIDQIAVVADDRTNAGCSNPAPELANLVRWQGSRAPLIRGLREDLERLAACGDRAIDGTRKAAGD